MNKKLSIGLIVTALVLAVVITGALYVAIPYMNEVAGASLEDSATHNVVSNPNLENLASSSKHEHTVVIDVEVLPTCTTTGLTEGKHCLTCGEIIVKQYEVPMEPHTYDSENDPECNICGHLRGDECAHMETEILPGVAPTCTTTGLTEGLRCKICHKTIRPQTVLGKIAHTPGNWILDSAATKTEDGYRHTSCTMCGTQVDYEVLPATGSIGLLYTLNSDGKGYSVSIGTSKDTEIVILSQYNGKPVTHIADNGFLNCDRIVSVSIPNSIKVIGNYAFGHCASLSDVTIPNSVTTIGEYAFRYCTAITSINIPNSVKTIGDYAFRYCTSLSDLTIGTGVTSIGDYAFYKCVSLESVTIPSNVSNIEWAVFAECASLVDITVEASNKNYKSINGNLYTKDEKTLIQYAMGKPETEFSIPQGVTHIDDYAFRGCATLVNVNIPSTVTYIGSGAFYNCTSLASVVIPNGVTSIGHSVFRNCTSLVSVQIPNSVKSIGSSAFYKCISLVNITIPNSVQSIGSSAFYKCSSLESIEIPNSVKSIGDYAFYKCLALESVKLGNGITKIDNYTFYHCTSLVNVELASSVTTIGDYVFAECKLLETINYGGTVHQWKLIEKGTYWNYATADDEIICSDGVTK